MFEHAAQHIQRRYGLSAERIKAGLIEREQIGSTGPGQGVAIPHARVDGVGSAVGLFIRAMYPFSFNAPDRRPVDEFILLVMPEEDHREHLELLADAARFFGERHFRLAARAAQAPNDVRRLLHPERLGSVIAQRTGAVTLVMMVDHPRSVAAPHVRDALDALAHGVQHVHLAYVEQPESLAAALLTEEGSGVVPCRRGNADLLLETRRYFADSTCTLRRDFSVERTTIVRF
ncbi:PTS sugar transporter subunit IIA [Burkholderia ubonensis]|uniref:PTS sugar transporter subunit IIA n=1 Tax=Burkholderia ubonensis TaxID=101571 RepID=UPI0007C8717B|nr:PTS sugar transporter subunit IIA [Burkholderia ubonensis]